MQLSDAWSREPDELRAGEPISRDITVAALGQLETQIPTIEPPVAAGVNVYPDRPALSRRLEAGGIRGMRTDQYAMIGVTAGQVVLPTIELPWWDVDAGRWRVARVPERVVTILPSFDAAPPEPAPPERETAEPAPAERPATAEGSPFWRRIAELLAALWLLTIAGWWWTSLPTRDRQPAPDVPLHRRQSARLKAARKAALAGDARGVREEMLAWGRLQWPAGPPRSIGDIAGRVSAPLCDELVALSRASYGKEAGSFDGRAMARALRSFAVVDAASEKSAADTLPPLMPGAASAHYQ